MRSQSHYYEAPLWHSQFLPDDTDPLRVLVVDDDQDTADVLDKLSRHLGHIVKVCRSGRECLGCINDFYPDVVLLDINMPFVDGYAVCRELRERDELRPIIVVACTAVDFEPVMRDDFSLYLRKPVPLESLHRVLAQSRELLQVAC